MTDWLNPKIEWHETVFQNRYQQIRRVTAQFDDLTKEYFVTDVGHKAGVVAVKDGHILLVRQYRLLINGLSYEIPGGKVEDGEDPAAAASRECLEETGIQCVNLHPLLSYQASLDTRHNPSHLFYCNEIAEEQQTETIQQDEVSGSVWLPLDRCIDMIFQQEIIDAFTIVALLTYRTSKIGQ